MAGWEEPKFTQAPLKLQMFTNPFFKRREKASPKALGPALLWVSCSLADWMEKENEPCKLLWSLEWTMSNLSV